MHVRHFVLLCIIPRATRTQDLFETAEFNITEALLSNGVKVSAIPGQAELGAQVLCNSLKVIFGDAKVENREETAYNAVVNDFWSAQQRESRPYCIFRPEKAVDVSTLILLSRWTQCPFAVRSGGHAAFTGASSVNGGVTVTFDNMKQISLSEDQKVASIEPGNLWYDIYTTLQKDNLAVVGGRVSTIGVGGLTTGGGISFFSNQYGWACDNVVAFEVVTASGQTVTASSSSYPDLYFALRGGGPNFGIVTAFYLETFAHGPLMFGGQRVFLNTSFPGVIDAFVNLGQQAALDPKAAQILSIALDAASNTQIAVAELEYADAVAQPAIFAEYKNISAVSDTTQLNTLAYFTQQLNLNNPEGYRETYWTASSLLDREMVQYVFDISFAAFASLRDVQGIVPANTLQVITVPQLEQMQNRGGNALGLSPQDGPIFLINLNVRWDKAEDDERVLKANANVVRKMKEEAERRGIGVDYLYMNYASQYQDVIGSYREKEKLKSVAAKYDPQQVFQRLMPGYFKLNGPPAKTEL